MSNLKKQLIEECINAKSDTLIGVMKSEGEFEVFSLTLEEACTMKLIPACLLVKQRKVDVNAIETLIKDLQK